MYLSERGARRPRPVEPTAYFREDFGAELRELTDTRALHEDGAVGWQILPPSLPRSSVCQVARWLGLERRKVPARQLRFFSEAMPEV